MTTLPQSSEDSALILGAWLETHSPATSQQIKEGTGLSRRQLVTGLQHFRRTTARILGVSITWNATQHVYVFTDELGDYITRGTIAGYESDGWKEVTSRTMTNYATTHAAYQRALINGDNLAIAAYRARTRAFRQMLEAFSTEARTLNNDTEHERIEAFLTTLEYV